MTGQQRILLAGGVACIVGVWTAMTLKQPTSRWEVGPEVHWIDVATEAASRDKEVLDAIMRDVLTNRWLASSREFYGGLSNRTVRYSGFPAGYRPDIAGYLFEPVTSSNSGSGLKLTLSLGGIWIDQPPPRDAQDAFRVLRPPYPAERGALLSFYNSGAPTTNGGLLTTTTGGCMFGYEIRSISNGWSVSFLGSWDP